MLAWGRCKSWYPLICFTFGRITQVEHVSFLTNNIFVVRSYLHCQLDRHLGEMPGLSTTKADWWVSLAGTKLVSVAQNLTLENQPANVPIYIYIYIWSDDLVLMTLTPRSVQKMLHHASFILHGVDCGDSVNINKTAIMVFNRSRGLLDESNNFFCGGTLIAPAREYIYLGVVFNIF